MQVEEYAKKMGYKGVKYVGKWNGYDVFRPIYEFDTNGLCLGNLLRILVKGDEVRMSTVLECYKILDFFNSVALNEKKKLNWKIN